MLDGVTEDNLCRAEAIGAAVMSLEDGFIRRCLEHYQPIFNRACGTAAGDNTFKDLSLHSSWT